MEHPTPRQDGGASPGAKEPPEPDNSEGKGGAKVSTIGLDSDDVNGGDLGLYKVKERDPPLAPSPEPFVPGIQHQGQRDRLNEEPGEGMPQCSKCNNNVCWCKDTRQPVDDTASTPTSTGRKFRPSHCRGRLRVPAAPPPSPATHDGQLTSIQVTEATNYQEGPTDDGDEHSERPPTDED